MRVKSIRLLAVIVTVFIFTAAPAPAQENVPAPEETAANAQKPKAETSATPEPTPEPDLWHREELTGDWGGARSQWKEKGVEMEFKLTQFYQGTAAGGLRQDDAYLGKFQTAFKFDLGKLAGWKYWSVDFETETRFGDPLLGGTGGINPVNTTAIIPAAGGSAFTVSALYVTRLFPIDLKKGDLIAVQVGRFNTLNLVDEDFFAEVIF